MQDDWLELNVGELGDRLISVDNRFLSVDGGFGLGEMRDPLLGIPANPWSRRDAEQPGALQARDIVIAVQILPCMVRQAGLFLVHVHPHTYTHMYIYIYIYMYVNIHT